MRHVAADGIPMTQPLRRIIGYHDGADELECGHSVERRDGSGISRRRCPFCKPNPTIVALLKDREVLKRLFPAEVLDHYRKELKELDEK